MNDKETLKLALDLVIMHHTDDGYSELRQKVRHAIKQALAAPTVQEPVAWVTVEDGKWISTRSADFRHITDGQYQLYVGPLAYEVPAAIKTLEALGYIYEEGEQWTAPPAQPAPVQEHVATLIEHYAFTDGIVRFDGVENMEQLPVGTKFYTTPPQNHV
jgi:hypothetical protein